MGIKINPDKLVAPLPDQLAAVYNSMPAEARGAFLPWKGAVWKELEAPVPDLEAIAAGLAALEVPAELEAYKTAMLEKLNEMG